MAAAKKIKKVGRPKKLGLLERLAAGPVICAEGYLFEFERRGYLQAGAKAAREVRRQFKEQIGWAAEAGVDFIVGETYSFGGEAVLATEMIKKHSSVPAVVTLAIHHEDATREGWGVAETCKRLED